MLTFLWHGQVFDQLNMPLWLTHKCYNWCFVPQMFFVFIQQIWNYSQTRHGYLGRLKLEVPGYLRRPRWPFWISPSGAKQLHTTFNSWRPFEKDFLVSTVAANGDPASLSLRPQAGAVMTDFGSCTYVNDTWRVKIYSRLQLLLTSRYPCSHSRHIPGLVQVLQNWILEHEAEIKQHILIAVAWGKIY